MMRRFFIFCGLWLGLVLCEQHDCGYKNPYGSEKAMSLDVKYPWVMHVVIKEEHVHGGALLSLKHVLTTANIFDGIDKVGRHNEVKVIPEFPGDSWDHELIWKEARRVSVRKVDVHVQYDPNNNHYNMAVLSLEEVVVPIGKSWHFKPLCLNIGQAIGIKQPLIAVSVHESFIKYANTTRALSKTCEQLEPHQEKYSICVEKLEHEVPNQVCNVGFGYPLFWLDKKTQKHYLVGLSTFKQQDCDKVPQLYTQIHQGIRGWLNYYTKPYIYQPDCSCGMENKKGIKKMTNKTEDFPQELSNVTSSRDYINFGTVAKKHQYPWEVLIRKTLSDKMVWSDFHGGGTWIPDYKYGYCMGSLVSTRHILTSASCINKKQSRVLGHEREGKEDELMAAIGFADIPVDINKESNLKVIIYVYVQPNEKSDVAILVLKDLVEFGPKVRPICLPDDNIRTFEFEIRNLKSAKIAGYGINEIGCNNFISRRYPLKEVELNINGFEACLDHNGEHINTNIKGFRMKLLKDHICSTSTFGKAPGHGDEGAALMKQYINGRYMIIGVYKSGQYPAVFTKITKETNIWIKKHADGTEDAVCNRYSSCNCGERETSPQRKQNRITGGDYAGKYDYPWMAILRILKEEGFFEDTIYQCGGTLVTTKHVVTAMHCIQTHDQPPKMLPPHRLWVKVGITDLDDPRLIKWRPIAEAHIYGIDQFGKRGAPHHYQSDTAILYLKTPVYWTARIRPACLPSNPFFNSHLSESNLDQVTETAGWGWVKKGGPLTTRLKKRTDLRVISNAVCANIMNEINKKILKDIWLGPAGYSFISYSRTSLCTSVGPCKGDSGGPTTVNEHGRQTLIGISSWAWHCEYDPNVKQKINYWVKDWILEHAPEARDSHGCNL